MQIDIPAHIEKLLFLHDALVIPGFGGFTATRTPASTDFVSGVVNPPAKTLAFSENLTVDDGLLVADIADSHGLSTQEAARSVDEFVAKMRGLLDQREIVTLPGVGRLYKNYVQKIQFLPDATNFNASSYGLPPLQFSPIARSREMVPGDSPAAQPSAPSQAEPKVTAPPPVAPPPMPEPTFSPERSKRSPKWLGVVGVLLLIVAALAAVWYWREKERRKSLDTSSPQTTEVAEAPPKPVAAPPAKEEPKVAAEETSAKAEDAVKEREKEAREQLSLAKNGRECILVVATLSNKENADKLRDLLVEEGYDPYFQPKGSAYLVGIRFRYLRASEIEEKRGALKALTGVNYIAVTKK